MTKTKDFSIISTKGYIVVQSHEDVQKKVVVNEGGDIVSIPWKHKTYPENVLVLTRYQASQLVQSISVKSRLETSYKAYSGSAPLVQLTGV